MCENCMCNIKPDGKSADLSLEDKLHLASPLLSQLDTGEVGFTTCNSVGALMPKVIDVNHLLCYAKYVKNNNQDTFFVKTNKLGFLFNPWDIFDEGKEAEYDSQSAQYSIKFELTTRETFDEYLKFLTTRKTIFLEHAERSRM